MKSPEFSHKGVPGILILKCLRSSGAEQRTVNPPVGISKLPASAKQKKAFFENKNKIYQWPSW